MEDGKCNILAPIARREKLFTKKPRHDESETSYNYETFLDLVSELASLDSVLD
jgi:hypothetical protein